MFDKHALAAGWDVSYQKSEEARLREEGLVGQVPLRRADSFRPQVLRLAAFVQDEWTVSSQWSISQGVRYEAIRTESEGTNLAGTQSRSQQWQSQAATGTGDRDRSDL
jgi:outer membrane receptor protein involved in Fe transport